MPDLKDNNPITANGTYHFRVNQCGRYRVVVGAAAKGDTDSAGGVGGRAFNGATVTVQQDGLAYTNLDGITAAAFVEANLSEGNLKVIVSGVAAGASCSIGIKIEPINSPA